MQVPADSLPLMAADFKDLVLGLPALSDLALKLAVGLGQCGGALLNSDLELGMRPAQLRLGTFSLCQLQDQGTGRLGYSTLESTVPNHDHEKAAQHADSDASDPDPEQPVHIERGFSKSQPRVPQRLAIRLADGGQPFSDHAEGQRVVLAARHAELVSGADTAGEPQVRDVVLFDDVGRRGEIHDDHVQVAQRQVEERLEIGLAGNDPQHRVAGGHEFLNRKLVAHRQPHVLHLVEREGTLMRLLDQDDDRDVHVRLREEPFILLVSRAPR